MSTLSTFPQASNRLRFATLLLIVFACVAAPLHTATAGDALTTSTSSTTTRKGILSSIFGSKSNSSSSSTGTSTTSQINRSILGLPIGIVKSATSLVSKAASKAVTSHITKN